MRETLNQSLNLIFGFGAAFDSTCCQRNNIKQVCNTIKMKSFVKKKKHVLVYFTTTNDTYSLIPPSQM